MAILMANAHHVSRDLMIGVVRHHIFGIGDPYLFTQYISFMRLRRRLRVVLVYSRASPLWSDFRAKILSSQNRSLKYDDE